jgi:hypothetical protein
VHGVAGETLGHVVVDQVDGGVTGEGAPSSSHFCCTSTDRGRWPAATARAITFDDSAM